MSTDDNIVMTMPGVLMLSATLAYENGNVKALSVVNRALALAAERGFTRGAEFRSAFRGAAADNDTCVQLVNEVFGFITPREFIHRVLGQVFASGQAVGGAA